jgi:hypothetical protein
MRLVSNWHHPENIILLVALMMMMMAMSECGRTLIDIYLNGE